MFFVSRHSVGVLIRNLPHVGSVEIEILNQVQEDQPPCVGHVVIEILNQVQEDGGCSG